MPGSRSGVKITDIELKIKSSTSSYYKAIKHESIILSFSSNKVATNITVLNDLNSGPWSSLDDSIFVDSDDLLPILEGRDIRLDRRRSVGQCIRVAYRTLWAAAAWGPV